MMPTVNKSVLYKLRLRRFENVETPIYMKFSGNLRNKVAGLWLKLQMRMNPKIVAVKLHGHV